MRDIRAAVPSPDGKSVLMEMTDTTANGGRPHLFLLSGDGKGQRQITFSSGKDEDGETAGRWSRDGDEIYFLAKRSGVHQLFRLSLAGGEATSFELRRKVDGALSETEGSLVDVRSYELSPDGAAVAVLGSDPKDLGRPKDKPADDDAYLVGSNLAKIRLYILALGSQPAAREVALPDGVEKIAWSPNAAQLVAVTATPFKERGNPMRVWLLSASGPPSAQQLSALAPQISKIAWSKSGRSIIYSTSTGDVGAPLGLEIYHLETRDTVRLAGALTDTLGDWAFKVNADDTLTTIVQVGFERLVAKYSLKTGKGERLDVGYPVTTRATANESGSAWAYISSDAETAGAVLLQRGRAKPHRLATPDMVPPAWKSVKGTRIAWKSGDLSIEGMLYLPPSAGEGKVPLIVHAHGGPALGFTDTHFTLVNLLVGQGWAVFHPNIRGSTGYGPAFEAANVDDLGGKDYEDVMSGVDAVIAKYPIDPDHMAFIGYSYGGTMAVFVLGKTDRFKAIVAGAPVTNQFSEVGTETASIAYLDSKYFGLPWERPQAALRQSPLFYIGGAKTPLLIIQGEKDPIDPPGQSEELYRALKMAGKPAVELMMLPREDHIQAGRNFYGKVSTEPWHGVAVRAKMLTFIKAAFGSSGPKSSK